jgi:signal transduction histidine kinase
VQANFWCDQQSEAWQAVQTAEASLPMMSGFVTALEQRFIAGLLACRHDVKHPFIQRSLDELLELNGLCPENFGHKLALLQAEIAFAEGQSIEQLAPLYQAAISSAETNGFVQYQALANELYCRAWLSKDFAPMAKIHLKHAKALYRKWGCTVKVENLKLEFKILFYGAASDANTQQEPETEPSLVSSSGASSSSTSSISAPSISTMGSTATTSLEGLDLSSVMKSAQVISGELEVKQLLAKVMQVIVENSGAQQAAFILNGEQGPSIEAQLQAEKTIKQTSRPLSTATDLPVSLIDYVLRSEREVSLQEEPEAQQQDGQRSIQSSEKAAYAHDVYLQENRPRSVVCIPVMYRDKALGALYLENTVSGKAFPKARFDVIKMLLAQAAISYENARLFTEVTELNVGLEEKVQQRTAELEMANKAMSSFSYTVSHDLRSPLRMIKGFSEVIAEDFADDLPPEAQMMFKKIIRGGEQMDELITGLLDLARLEQKELERDQVDLSEMANTIITNIREQAPERQANVQIEAGLAVSGDKRMLYSVLENLLNNAWKYSSKSEQTDIRFFSQQQAGKTVYMVKDQGAGFDMKHIEKLFATFQRLHTAKEFAGTGVGLSTVKRVIEKHGGEIWAEAEQGKGATFYFTLG